MIRVRQTSRRPQAENTVALVNIVFLMLIFFLIAGAIAPPLEKDLSMIETSEAPPLAPPDALAARGDGTLVYRGEPVTAADYVNIRRAEADGGDVAVKLVADRDLPASRLIEIITALKREGRVKVTVVTERATK